MKLVKSLPFHCNNRRELQFYVRLLPKLNVAHNEAALSYHRVRVLNFPAVIVLATIVLFIDSILYIRILNVSFC